MFELLDRLSQIALIEVSQADIAERAVVGCIGGQHGLKLSDGFFRGTRFKQHHAVIVVEVGIARLETDSLGISFGRGRGISLALKSDTKLIPGGCVVRLQLDSCF